MRGSQGIRTRKRVHFKFQFTPLHERQPSHRELRWRPWSNFNSRLYMRGSVFLMLFFVIIFYFNSRLYMRGSISAAQHLACSIHFNSRLYMRGSFVSSHGSASHELFQFTPLHERQPDRESLLFRLPISIHASTWEAASPVSVPIVSPIFQFTPLHERQRS